MPRISIWQFFFLNSDLCCWCVNNPQPWLVFWSFKWSNCCLFFIVESNDNSPPSKHEATLLHSLHNFFASKQNIHIKLYIPSLNFSMQMHFTIGAFACWLGWSFAKVSFKLLIPTRDTHQLGVVLAKSYNRMLSNVYYIVKLTP